MPVKSILEWLRARPQPTAMDEIRALRHITESLEKLDPDRAKYIACFSFLLARVAGADLDVRPEEVETMGAIVGEIGRLEAREAALVVEIARVQNRLFGSVDNYRVTREFRTATIVEDRLLLLECLFAVGAADGSISSVEESEIRKIASELGLSHDDFLAARSAYRDKLSVFQSLPKGTH